MEARLSWWDRSQATIAGWQTSRQFRRWAAAFPLTRPIARRRAKQLFDLCAGFVYSQVLLACVRLRVFEILADGPQTAATMSPQLALTTDATARLLDAAVSLRLLVRRAGRRYALGPLGAPLVGNEALAAMIEHHSALYADLRDPVDLLRNDRRPGELASYWPYAGVEVPANLSAERVARYSALMSASQPLIADEVLDAYSLKSHRCLLDVGGGEGSFLVSVAARAPALKMMLFDLPAVAERARLRFGALGLSDRVSVHGGSFLSDSLPAGADIISLVRVLHDHDDDSVLNLLGAVRRALPDDGMLLIAEPMSETPGAETMGDAYFGFYLLAMGRGRPRTPARIGELLHEAGFDSGRLVATHLPIQTRLIVAGPE
ncbi:MAG: methyltransferase [Panacagrimonas sp.]